MSLKGYYLFQFPNLQTFLYLPNTGKFWAHLRLHTRSRSKSWQLVILFARTQGLVVYHLTVLYVTSLMSRPLSVVYRWCLLLCPCMASGSVCVLTSSFYHWMKANSNDLVLLWLPLWGPVRNMPHFKVRTSTYEERRHKSTCDISDRRLSQSQVSLPPTLPTSVERVPEGSPNQNGHYWPLPSAPSLLCP